MKNIDRNKSGFKDGTNSLSNLLSFLIIISNKGIMINSAIIINNTNGSKGGPKGKEFSGGGEKIMKINKIIGINNIIMAKYDKIFFLIGRKFNKNATMKNIKRNICQLTKSRISKVKNDI